MSNYKHLIQENAWLREQLAVMLEHRKADFRKTFFRPFLSPEGQTEAHRTYDRTLRIQAEANRLAAEAKKGRGPFQDVPGLGGEEGLVGRLIKAADEDGRMVPGNETDRLAELKRISDLNKKNNPKPVKKS